MYGAVYLWKQHRPAKPDHEPRPAIIARSDAPDFSLRAWTDRNGRNFEGNLVSAKGDRVIVRRQSDLNCFLVYLSSLSAGDQAYVTEQIRRAETSGQEFVEMIPGYQSISRKLEIKGHILRVKAPAAVGGSKLDRVDPSFWFLLSDKLHGENEGSLWLRVDERMFRTYQEGSLLNASHLSSFTGKNGELVDALKWPRSRVTLVEARYGPPDKVLNVTEKVMRLACEGSLPIQIGWELFDCRSHGSEVWDMTLVWRTPEGELRQTLRDGALLSIP